MCSHYENIRDPQRLFQAFGAAAPASMGKVDVWPQYEGLFIRVPPHRDSGDEAVPEREALPGRFGLIPHWATDLKLGRNTFNARSETAATKPSFRDAWKWARHCIVPAESIFEPDWRSGKAIATRIKRKDGQPMGLAGLFAWWKDEKGTEIHSFTLDHQRDRPSTDEPVSQASGREAHGGDPAGRVLWPVVERQTGRLHGLHAPLPCRRTDGRGTCSCLTGWPA
jgi:hypothetical protein